MYEFGVSSVNHLLVTFGLTIMQVSSILSLSFRFWSMIDNSGSDGDGGSNDDDDNDDGIDKGTGTKGTHLPVNKYVLCIRVHVTIFWRRFHYF